MTAGTASCFLHGYYDARLKRCPKCATDALTRRAEKAEAEAGRLREQLDAARAALRDAIDLAEEGWSYADAPSFPEASISALRAALEVGQ